MWQTDRQTSFDGKDRASTASAGKNHENSGDNRPTLINLVVSYFLSPDWCEPCVYESANNNAHISSTRHGRFEVQCMQEGGCLLSMNCPLSMRLRERQAGQIVSQVTLVFTLVLSTALILRGTGIVYTMAVIDRKFVLSISEEATHYHVGICDCHRVSISGRRRRRAIDFAFVSICTASMLPAAERGSSIWAYPAVTTKSSTRTQWSADVSFWKSIPNRFLLTKYGRWCWWRRVKKKQLCLTFADLYGSGLLHRYSLWKSFIHHEW